MGHRHGELRRDERGVGCLGFAGQHAGARHGRSQARFARLQGRDHGGGGKVVLFLVMAGLVPAISLRGAVTTKRDHRDKPGDDRGPPQEKCRMSSLGILAIFNDVRAGREAEFDHWFQSEHLLERLAVPGFLYGRRHQALSGGCGYFNFYMVESPDVLKSKPYLERLDNPTPMTKVIMSEVFQNMNRTVCHRTHRRGGFRGAFAVTARFNDTPDASALTAALDELVHDTAIAGGEIWAAVDPAGMPVSM